MILDAGFLSPIDRRERSAHTFLAAADRSATGLHTTHPVVAQVWRNGARQARLSAFLKIITIQGLDDGRPVGRLLAQTKTSDIGDAHLVICTVRLGHDILTGDPNDLITLTSALGPAAPHRPPLALTAPSTQSTRAPWSCDLPQAGTKRLGGD